MLLDSKGFLYEGWFKDNQIIYGRCFNTEWKYLYIGYFWNFKENGKGTALFDEEDPRIINSEWKEGKNEELTKIIEEI
jgi:hypothetical protein